MQSHDTPRLLGSDSPPDRYDPGGLHEQAAQVPVAGSVRPTAHPVVDPTRAAREGRRAGPCSRQDGA